MNRPPPERVVPTLTEVLDEQRWQTGDASAGAETLVPVPVAAAAIAADELLPSLAEPLIDLSDLAVLGPDAQHDALFVPDFEAPEDLAPAVPVSAVSEDVDPALEPALRLALSKALSEAIPDLVDLLVPILRRQLAADLERPSNVDDTQGGSLR